MACPPDRAVAEMATLLAEAATRLEEAVGHLGRDSDLASGAADAAVKCDLREVTGRRELYRRCSRIGETVVDVAERIQYAVVKES